MLLQISLSPAQTQRNEEQIKFLTEKINSLVDEAEQMGIQGNVEQAQGLMKLCDQLKEEREQLRGNNENSHWQQVTLCLTHKCWECSICNHVSVVRTVCYNLTQLFSKSILLTFTISCIVL